MELRKIGESSKDKPGENREQNQFILKKQEWFYSVLQWSLCGVVLFGVMVFLISQFNLFPQKTLASLEKVHPFLLTSAVANHVPNTQMEAVGIWLCDHCHNTFVDLTDGSTRQIGLSSLSGGGNQTVSQGQEWGPTVAGMFSGKHAAAESDALGQTVEVYSTYLNTCYGPGTNAAMITGANMRPCRSGGGTRLISRYNVMPPDAFLSQPNSTCTNTNGSYAVTGDPDCPIRQDVSQFVGTIGNQNLGKAVSVIGDLGTPTSTTPDGRKDFAIADGAPGTAGRVWVVSGADPSGPNPAAATDTLICRIDGSTGSDFGAGVSSPGDLTGNGTPDILISAPGAAGGNGEVYLFDGSTCAGGAVLTSANATWTFTGQAGDRIGAVALVGSDLGGVNANPEVLAMAPLASAGAGRVYVLDGANGASLITINGAAGDSLGGGGFPNNLSVPSTTLSNQYGADGLHGDANGDGFFDIVVGAPGNNVVKVFSGNPSDAGLQLGVNISGPAAGARFGSAVAGLGNRLAVGAPNSDDGAAGTVRSGRAHIYSVTAGGTPTYTKIFDLDPPGAQVGAPGFDCPASNCLHDDDQFGLTLIAVGDITQENTKALVIGSSYAHPGEEVSANSLARNSAPDGGKLGIYTDNQLRHTFEAGTRRNAQIGFIQMGASAAADDIDGDGRPDLVVGGPLSHMRIIASGADPEVSTIDTSGTLAGAGAVTTWWNVSPFAPTPQYTLSVTKDGSGTGTVTSSPVGINCGADCSELYDENTLVTLTATPDSGSVFSGWSGDPDCSDGSVTVDTDKTCNATFTAQYTLTVTKTAGMGSGTVTSSPAGINCGPDCSEPYIDGTVVILTATPDAGSTFLGWSGDPDCADGTVTMNGNKTCDANFELLFALSVTKAGTGGGTVSSSPVGINCGTDCSEIYVKGTVVTLTATPDGSSLFAGWTGDMDCSDGSVTMDANKTCTANFDTSAPGTFSLAVNKIGSGSGTVTSNPAGINCGADCNEIYNDGTVVVLTATANPGSTFIGWSGSDPDCNDGSVTMSQNLNCTATFELIWTLNVTKSGSGAGTVTSVPIGINCGADCTEIYLNGTSVVLSPTPGPGSVFIGWTGDPDCSDGTVTMNSNKTCDAEFSALFTLTITKSGTGTGTVTSTPVGINCGTDCTEDYADGTVVALTTTPDAGSVFAEWSGDPDCSDGSLTMGASKTCDATFEIDTTRLGNISTRSFVGTSGNVQIGGFIIEGSDPLTVLIRAQGPSLVDFGVTGVLANPTMQIFSGSTVIAQNNDWQTTDPFCAGPAVSCGNDQDIIATGLDPCTAATTGCTLDSAVHISLPPGAYTAIVSGVGGGTGVGLIGVFDVDSTTGNSKLGNISTRSFVGTGANVQIGGFIVEGTNPKTVLVRAQGPSLVDFGVTGVLANPTMQIFSGSTVIAQNNNWQTTDPLCAAPAISCGNDQDIIATGLDPCTAATTGCTLDSAVHITLPPGAYTAIVSGVSGGTGVGLIGVFDVVPAGPPTFTLNVTKTGTGSGTVTSNPVGINCGADCTEVYSDGTIVNLTATPNAGSVFAGWSGDGDCADASVTLNSNKTCTATFNAGTPTTHTLTISLGGTGAGSVTSSPAGINCGADCTEVYNDGTVVTLTPAAGAGAVFSGWSGVADCSDGIVTITADITCTANFDQIFTLTITKTGTGTGTVTSSPPGINCGVDCNENYSGGTVIALTPTPDAGSVFTGWSGNADCLDGSVTMDNNKTCNAIFDQEFTLTINKIGVGTGTVTSNPIGINCGADCTETYISGTVVTLTASPDAGSLFSGWTGDPDCSDGMVTMDANKTCTATFDPAPPSTFTLSVTKSGTGTGTVTSSPAGIICGADCIENYTNGTVVTLTAMEDAGSTFTGWTGDPDCVDGSVTVTANITCNAQFDILFNLTVSLAGTGNGIVTSSPLGINCGPDCTENYITGTVVNLTANSTNGSTFAGWSGNADCMDGSVTMNSNISCTATFNLVPPGTTTWEVEVGPANDYTVHTSANPIDNGSTNEAHITIYEGDSIQWNWTDTNHSATSTATDKTKVFGTCSNGESFDTGVFDPPHMDSTILNIATPGGNDCQFFCLTHSNNMRGSITVLSRAGNAAPSAPTNLVANVVAHNWIELNWTASTDDLGVTSYDIYRNAVLIGTKKIRFGDTSTSFTDSTGQPNTNYDYTVVAVDGAKAVSGPSNTANVTTTVTKLWEVEVGPGNQFTTRTSQNPADINTPRVTIFLQDKIRWTWSDPNHSVTSGTTGSGFIAGACSSGDNFDSGIQSTVGYEFTHFFNNGTAPSSNPCLYFCTQHNSITGQQITVLPRP
jgi:plastocyanin